MQKINCGLEFMVGEGAALDQVVVMVTLER